MKIFFNLFLFVMSFFVWTTNSCAFVNYEDIAPKKVINVKVVGFTDYAPFGYLDIVEINKRPKFFSPLKTIMHDIAQKNNLEVEYNNSTTPYAEKIQDVRQGKSDVAFGIYHDTQMFDGIEILFPAAFINPITIFMMPNRIDEVKNTDDLKKLKGVRNSKETFSDFVEDQLKNYNITTVNSSYEMFEMLFTKKADYIVASQYYGLIEASKLGLRSQISVAKQTLWQIPMFVGVSKLSKNRKLLSQKITQWLNNKENQKLLEQEIVNIVNEEEIKAYGIVPPNFDTPTNTEKNSE